jgi:tetratricopeptide (TPR) repeat protein
MATNRLEILQQMLQADPNNSFARYGLAMEYARTGDYRTAVDEFRTLLAADAGYAAAYFHYGQALEKLGDLEAAKRAYEQGIQVTTAKGDNHTRAELEAALSLLPV